MNILLADDQPQVRSALRLLLEQRADRRIVAEAADAHALWRLALALGPDIILLDWELPGLSGADGVSDFCRGCPSARIVALSSHPEARQVALEAGVDAFVSKGDPPEQLLDAIKGASGDAI